jgi:hypothetical protein
LLDFEVGGVRLVFLMLKIDVEDLVFIDWRSDVSFKW